MTLSPLTKGKLGQQWNKHAKNPVLVREFLHFELELMDGGELETPTWRLCSH